MKIFHDWPSYKYTWMKVGRIIDNLYLPQNEQDWRDILQLGEIYPLGNCSNLIVMDKPTDHVFVKMQGLNKVEIRNGLVYAQAGVLLSSLALFLQQNSLAGGEFFCGIPGSFGGAIFMNAGCYGSETKDVLKSVELLDKSTGQIDIMDAKEMNFSYRNSNIKNKIVLGGYLQELSPNDAKLIGQKMTEIAQKRVQAQPQNVPTCGSTFRNPSSEMPAWRAIKESGANLLQFGGAKMSEKHCNFMLNSGGATGSDCRALGDAIIEQVYKVLNIKLEYEIKFI